MHSIYENINKWLNQPWRDRIYYFSFKWQRSKRIRTHSGQIKSKRKSHQLKATLSKLIKASSMSLQKTKKNLPLKPKNHHLQNHLAPILIPLEAEAEIKDLQKVKHKSLQTPQQRDLQLKLKINRVGKKTLIQIILANRLILILMRLTLKLKCVRFMRRLVQEIYRELAKRVVLAISLTEKGSLEGFLILEKLGFASPSRMDNAQNHLANVSMLTEKLKLESWHTTTFLKKIKGIIEDSRKPSGAMIEGIKEVKEMITIIGVLESKDHIEIIEIAETAETFRVTEIEETIEDRGITAIVQDKENMSIGIIGTAAITEIRGIDTKTKERDIMLTIKFEVLRCTHLLLVMDICRAIVNDL